MIAFDDLIIGWLFGEAAKMSTDAAAKALRDSPLIQSLKKATAEWVKEWKKRIPDLYPDAFWEAYSDNQIGKQTTTRPARGKIIESLASGKVISEQEWTDALKERWQDIRAAHGTEAAVFFRAEASDVATPLADLGKRLFLAATQNTEHFQPAVIRILLDLQNAQAPRADYSVLQEISDTVDKELIKTIRALRFISQEEIATSYENQVNGLLLKEHIEAGRLLSSLRNPSFMRETSQSSIEPSLKILVGDSRSWIRYESSASTIEIKNPPLLWNCIDKYPRLNPGDAEKREKLSCPIHSNPAGSTIESFMRNSLVRIQYRNIGVHWFESPEFWPPAVDSLYMIDVLESEGVFDQPANRVLDLGCGTGFLGIYAGKRIKGVTHVTFSDWLLTPLLFSAMNWYRNNSPAYIETEFLLGLNTSWKFHSKSIPRFDLVLCNPPYLPLPDINDFRKIGLDSTVAGTELLEHLIKVSTQLGEKVYFVFSDLAQQEAQDAANTAGKRLEPIGKPLPVPFRVVPAFKYPEYIRYLVDKRGLTYSPEQLHPFWHKIGVWTVS